MLKKLVIRADDLGYCDGVNAGIARSVNEGLIRSIGVMVNMPWSKDGLRRIVRKDVCLGLHTNLCVGLPVCNPKEIPSLVQEDGRFHTSRTYRQAENDFIRLDDALREVEAQYQRFKELTGTEPGYIEAHAVQSETFFQALELTAEKHDIPCLPFSLDQPVSFRHSRVQLILESMKPDYDPEQLVHQIVQFWDDWTVIPVLVCHPGYLDSYLLKTSSLLVPRTAEVEMAVSSDLADWLKQQNVELISFDEID